MAKKKTDGQKKSEPVSLRVDETTMHELEAIGDAAAEIGNAAPTTSAMVLAAIKEYIAKRRGIVDKHLPAVLKRHRDKKE